MNVNSQMPVLLATHAQTLSVALNVQENVALVMS